MRKVIRASAVASLLCCWLAPPGAATAEPNPSDGNTTPIVAAVPAAGAVESAPPVSLTSPDGWTLSISAKGETQEIAAPLTTAISSREYIVGGIFAGSVTGPGDAPQGVFEVGYQIGCGIDMSSSNGVQLGGALGVNPTFAIIDGFPDLFAEGVRGNIGGTITVGLKPGIINIVPVTKKSYEGTTPWVMIGNFHIKIDGCVGESFIRSYATLTRSTKLADVVLSWYGTTKKV